MKQLDLISPVISGVGAVSCAGINCRETRSMFFERSERRLPTAPSPRCGTTLSDPVFELVELETTGANRNNMLVTMAIDEALENAKLTREMLAKYRVGVCLGTTTAGQLNNLKLYSELRDGNYSRISEVDTFVHSSPAELLRRQYNLNGPALTVSNACASGTDAAGIAQYWLSQGKCDIVLVTGVDELNHIPVAGFHALGVASSAPCRPFDRDRSGLNLGEGAACCVMETFDNAVKRGVAPAFELLSYGNACDAYHATSPHPEGRGLADAITQALVRAKVSAQDIAFINAHGTSTRANDLCEGKVFDRLFGSSVPYLSTKGWTGHTLGAAGTLEMVFTILMLEQGEIPASCGFENRDPEIPGSPASSRTILKNPEFALSNSLAFGGSNAAAVIRRRR